MKINTSRRRWEIQFNHDDDGYSADLPPIRAGLPDWDTFEINIEAVTTSSVNSQRWMNQQALVGSVQTTTYHEVAPAFIIPMPDGIRKRFVLFSGEQVTLRHSRSHNRRTLATVAVGQDKIPVAVWVERLKLWRRPRRDFLDMFTIGDVASHLLFGKPHDFVHAASIQNLILTNTNENN